MGTKPYLCPVCKGKTTVKKGFYPDDPERINCKACFNGVVFGTEYEYTWIPSLPYQWSYTGSGYVSSVPTGSNPPTIPEVAEWLGGDYLNPGIVSEDG